jgi:2-desacetyl-2-hydroxyethyl bacteriochlorophyllide A dehydrogenase
MTRGGVVSVEQVDDPIPGAGQVLVAPLACGICGSDLHMVKAQSERPEQIPPIVLGHEFVAQVVEYGPHTRRDVPPGGTVTSVPYLDTPAGPQLIGLSPLVGGGLAELTVLQESRMLAVAHPRDAEYVAVTEPLAVGVHAVAAARMRTEDSALVLGCGPVGLAVITALRARGHGPIVAADFAPGRRRVAETVGATAVMDPRDHSPYRDWVELTGPELPASPLIEGDRHGTTVVFECTGVPGVLENAIASVPTHTRIVVVGVSDEPEAIAPMTAIVKEVSIQFVFAYRPQEFAEALRWIVEGVVDVRPLVTATYGLEAVADAFAKLRQPDEHAKILILPGGQGKTWKP